MNSRRSILKKIASLFIASLMISKTSYGKSLEKLMESEILTGNFRFIYENPELKTQFLLFLENVFNLFPENVFHELINTNVSHYQVDEIIYQQTQNSLSSISPILRDLRYALPTLSRQKVEMAKQTTLLLGTHKRIDSYLEVGSTGRYLDELENHIEIGDARYFISDKDTDYSLTNCLDRGQISKAGIFIPLNNYDIQTSAIPPKSLELITVYIGFHHCPDKLRDNFITNLRDLLVDDGLLILRDHDVTNQSMWHMVALAHDVFNMGTFESWQYNANELRLFYSLDYLKQLMLKNGFKTDGRRIYQAGDPTKNALMVFSKA